MSTHRLAPEDELAPTRRSLLARLRNLEDSEAWQEFFDIYWKLIYCAAIKGGLSDVEAEDVVQETIVSVARGMEKFRYEPAACSFKGWLMLLTRHRIIDHFRKITVRPRGLLPLPSDTTTSGAEPPIPDMAAQRAFECMWNEEWEKNLVDAALERVKRRVNPKHYQIFYLHSVKNLPAKRIAERLKVSLAKVYVVRHRVGRLIEREAQALTKAGEGLAARGPDARRERLAKED
jgi:RNA polymerase sigma-70 factor (ECF subfamily)